MAMVPPNMLGNAAADSRLGLPGRALGANGTGPKTWLVIILLLGVGPADSHFLRDPVWC